MKLQILDNSCKTSLEEAIGLEFTARQFYISASSWCRNKGYDGGAKYFLGEADDEASHAQGIIEFMNGWNIEPVLPAVKAPERDFDSLKDLIEKAYQMEYSLLEKYNDKSKKAFDEGEFNVFDLFTKYRKIQNKSVAEYSDFLNKISLIGENDKLGMFLFDKEVLGA